MGNLIGLLFFAAFGLGLGHLFQSFHLLELLQGGTVVDTILVVQTDLPVGLSEVEEARLALDESYYKVPVLLLVLVPEGDVDFSQIFRDPVEVGEDLQLLVRMDPVFGVEFAMQEVG